MWMFKMKIYEESSYWLMLRVTQFIITVFCLILEIIQVILFMSLLQNTVPLSIYFSNNGQYKGEVKIWYYIVIGLSAIGLGKDFALHILKDYMKKDHSSLSKRIANLYPLYDGGLVCNAKGYDSEIIPHQYYLWCRSYLISTLLSWMNTLAFVITILFSSIILGQNEKNETILERTLFRFKHLRETPTNNPHIINVQTD
ncbi:unnamed protein product [Rhizophagus irregularis]|uniref:Uncharacterized protein n=2 Tax=Rhizophagus irregularis TaxID=588596 RepID=A0A915ZYJ5_9GLOM|nr:unnamed protein product [Rhizophagus irregularis]